MTRKQWERLNPLTRAFLRRTMTHPDSRGTVVNLGLLFQSLTLAVIGAGLFVAGAVLRVSAVLLRQGRQT